jgi:hypothetical protein
MSIEFDQKTINRYLDLMEKDPFHRYWSWDFCFKAFSETRENVKERLPLTLSSYLASWGMYRGSGGLLQINHRIHEKAVEIIYSTKYDLLRCSKNQEVNRSLIPLILELKDSIGAYYNSLDFLRGGLIKKLSDTDTLLSKIILGTTGCVPAYDRFFIAGMKISNIKKSRFNGDCLSELFDFIDVNKTLIKKSQEIVKEKTNSDYPAMKLIDMYFWQIGYDSETNKNRLKNISST